MLKKNSADLTIGFDVGGTNVRGGVITREGEILASRTVPTSMDAEQLEADIVGIVDELRADYEVDAVGLALAGFLDPTCEVVRFCESDSRTLACRQGRCGAKRTTSHVGSKNPAKARPTASTS